MFWSLINHAKNFIFVQSFKKKNILDLVFMNFLFKWTFPLVSIGFNFLFFYTFEMKVNKPCRRLPKMVNITHTGWNGYFFMIDSHLFVKLVEIYLSKYCRNHEKCEFCSQGTSRHHMFVFLTILVRVSKFILIKLTSYSSLFH